VKDYGDAVILPGLVNAHTHLELSGCAAGEAPASFTDWIGSMPARIGPARDFGRHARDGAGQSIGFGVTCVGDISQQSEITRAVLRDGTLRVVSFGEVLGIGATRWKVDELTARATDLSSASEWLTVGLSPHAPYSLGWPDYQKAVGAARMARLPIATHLAELPDERMFLEKHSGELREFLDRMGIWQEDVETFRGGPIEMARAAGLLDERALLAHVNYCDDDEIEMLARGKASVVYCPRTHRYFGHPAHRWREMLGRGINVAVGTDSCASSPNLNLVDDLRLMHEIAPEAAVETLWEMGTIRGARAVQMEGNVGSLIVGKFADMVVFPAKAEEPLREILENDVRPMAVWIGGHFAG
jgi:cytosine/adenosine deaminase-related metal-dependent hydrolase